MEQNELPIAVIDSGVGGISVLAELIRVMPEEDFLYFGDSANAPYGTKSHDEVLRITRENLAMLRKIGIKALVIACNTATGVAAKILREENPTLPILGIEPAIKPATLVAAHPRVLVMATPLTLREEKFRALVARFADLEDVVPLPCPGLADLIEDGHLDDQVIDEYLFDLLSPHREEKIDAIVLGCTHYPHIREKIDEFFSHRVPILDGGAGTARETARRLTEAGLLRKTPGGKITILNSDGEGRLTELSRTLLDRLLGKKGENGK